MFFYENPNICWTVYFLDLYKFEKSRRAMHPKYKVQFHPPIYTHAGAWYTHQYTTDITRTQSFDSLGRKIKFNIEQIYLVVKLS
jgi:hypothetical protein